MLSDNQPFYLRELFAFSADPRTFLLEFENKSSYERDS